MKRDKHIFLIGFMGCGKTTTAKKLSEMTGAVQIEMDEEIVKTQKMEITDIFEKYGQEYFRDLETGILERLAEGGDFVVSCGGGAVLRERNVELMKKGGTIVLLTALPETVYERVKDSTDRPNLKGRMNVKAIGELMDARRESYERAADLVIPTDGRTTEEICREIIRQTRWQPGQTGKEESQSAG